MAAFASFFSSLRSVFVFFLGGSMSELIGEIVDAYDAAGTMEE